MEVSVSYRSYILSYFIYSINSFNSIYPSCFRLLSELYSFLFFILSNSFISIILSFRLLSELYSFLFNGMEDGKKILFLVSVSYRSYILSYLGCFFCKTFSIFRWFPSPIGVIFFLIEGMIKGLELQREIVSVSYRSYILSYCIW